MMRVSAVYLVVFCIASIATPPPARAWGPAGHRIVCAIAYELLDADQRKEVDRLTHVFKRPDGNGYKTFSSACVFADDARSKARDRVQGWRYFKRFEEWHFLNLPRDVRKVDAAHCADNCVLRGIEYHAGQLAKHDLEDWKRAEALFFLGHWVGDVHQPLHVSYQDDLGGNEITPITGGYYDASHLHGVWDSGIIAKAITADEGAYAKHLAAGITPELRTAWLKATPLEWAQESYDVTITPDVTYCVWEKGPDGDDWCAARPTHGRNLQATYETEFRPVVERRLQQAGARLADRIAKALASP